MPSQYPFKNKTYLKVTHRGILANCQVLEDIGTIVRAPKKKMSLLRRVKRTYRWIIKKITKCNNKKVDSYVAIEIMHTIADLLQRQTV